MPTNKVIDLLARDPRQVAHERLLSARGHKPIDLGDAVIAILHGPSWYIAGPMWRLSGFEARRPFAEFARQIACPILRVDRVPETEAESLYLAHHLGEPAGPSPEHVTELVDALLKKGAQILTKEQIQGANA